jgi:hypothetical protein
MRGHSARTYCGLRCKLACSRPLSPSPSPRSGARGARLWARLSATRRWAAGLPYSVDRRSQPHVSTALGWINRRGLRDPLRAFGAHDRTHEDRRDNCCCQIVGDVTVLGPRSCSALRAHIDNTDRGFSIVVARSGLTVLSHESKLLK